MTGDVGVGNWQAAAKVTKIYSNKFGEDVRIITGNVGSEAAAAFISKFLD